MIVPVYLLTRRPPSPRFTLHRPPWPPRRGPGEGSRGRGCWDPGPAATLRFQGSAAEPDEPAEAVQRRCPVLPGGNRGRQELFLEAFASSFLTFLNSGISSRTH